MSAPAPQEIRDRLGSVEKTLAEIAERVTSKDSANPATLAMLLDSKTNVLHAAALTLLVEQQRIANLLAAAQVWATMGEHRAAREILQEIGDV